MSSNLTYEDVPANEFESMLANIDNNEPESQIILTQSLGLSWRELSRKEFINTEKILFGLLRGNVGTLCAVTNLGKTTLSLNICLVLASCGTFYPFVKEHQDGRRVMIIDGESTQPELKADIKIMMRDWSPQERAMVEENLLILCDEEIDDEPLNLSDPRHIAAITGRANEFKPDLIVVDTLSALFNLKSENDNAEIKRVVMQPLKKLAKDANAAVLLLHHIGKQNEDGRASVGAYAGRGGSNIGALSRTVTLLKTDTSDPERVVFSVPKAKGYRLEPLLMKLDHESRWFVPANESVPPQQTSYEILVSTVKSFGQPVKRKEIDEQLAGRMGKSTITRELGKAETRGDLVSPKYGYYGAPEDSQSPENLGY